MSAGTKFPHLTPRRSILNGFAIVAVAASVFAPFGAPQSEGLPLAVPVAQAAQQIDLGPAPQVTDPSALAPTITTEPRAGKMAVNTADRTAVVNLFNNVYTPALQVQANWTGSISGCNAGATSSAFQTATISMVNYFRAMSGLPDNVVLDTTSSTNAQQAALMMIAQGSLSHSPQPGWACFTPAGAQSASESNLALGVSGPSAVVGYMQDPGSSNVAVGHRRWILYPPQATMGTGDTTATNAGFVGSNALDVIGGFGTRPATPAFVAWPSQGFVPYQIVYPRWSFSYPQADFSIASVTMTQGATPVTVALQPQQQGFGDNTIVWEPSVSFTNPPASDTPYTVNVNNVRINGVPQNFTYTVTVINPATGGGGVIGGKGFGISSGANGVQLTWNAGAGQTGYQIARLANNVVSVLPNAPLDASATSYLDTTAPNGLVCYAIMPLGTNPQQFGDFLCSLVGFHSANGSPQAFTLRLNQSTTASMNWTAPANGGQDGYILVKLGAANQTLGPSITSTLGSANTGQLTCWALAATLNGQITGWTDFECGLPGFSTLAP